MMIWHVLHWVWMRLLWRVGLRDRVRRETMPGSVAPHGPTGHHLRRGTTAGTTDDKVTVPLPRCHTYVYCPLSHMPDCMAAQRCTGEDETMG